MKHSIKKVCILFMCAAIVFMSSCTMKTNLTIDDKFSGTRAMICSLSSDDLSILTEDVESVNEKIDAILPQELTYTCVENSLGGYDYTFILEFDSFEDYEKKVESLLGRDTKITYTKSNNIFTPGFTLKEEFTSADLLKWLETAIEEKSLIELNADNVKHTETSVKWSNIITQTKTSGNKTINVVVSTPIQMNSINIFTDKIDVNTFKRTVTYSFPEFSANSIGVDNLYSYMSSFIPKSASFSIDDVTAENGDKEKAAVISFTASDIDSLADMTATAIGGTKFDIAYESDDSGSIFKNSWNLKETFDLSLWETGKGALCPIIIEYKMSDGTRAYNNSVTSGGKELSGSISNNGRIVTFSHSGADKLVVNIAAKSQYVVSGVDVYLAEVSNTQLTKTCVLYYTDEQYESGYAATYSAEQLKKLNVSNTEFEASQTNDGRGKLTITISGTPEEISAACTTLFKDECTLTYALDNESKFKLTKKYNINDSMSLSEFLADSGFTGSINYTFIPYNENEVANFYIKDISGNVIDKKLTLAAEAGQQQISTTERIFKVELVSSTKNYFLVIAACAGIGIIVLAIVFIFLRDKFRRRTITY